MTADTVWHTNLRRLIGEWKEETGDVPVPVSLIEDYFYEALSDQSRSKNLSNGIFLSTVHSIKGLEFDHVFLLGDGWQKKQGLEMEEERRLYYVGMSRARETLHLFNSAEHPNPHAVALTGDFMSFKKVHPAKKELSTNIQYTQYTFLGMEDLYLDFAGRKNIQHPTRKAVQKLQAGDRLRLERRNDHIELINPEGISVARLSKMARDKWEGKTDSIREVRVVAMVRRYREDINDKSFGTCHGDIWEVPVVDLCW
jgi:ATP-dependent DNA helicase RecQ